MTTSWPAPARRVRFAHPPGGRGRIYRRQLAESPVACGLRLRRLPARGATGTPLGAGRAWGGGGALGRESGGFTHPSVWRSGAAGFRRYDEILPCPPCGGRARLWRTRRAGAAGFGTVGRAESPTACGLRLRPSARAGCHWHPAECGPGPGVEGGVGSGSGARVSPTREVGFTHPAEPSPRAGVMSRPTRRAPNGALR
jgi:hypothetical protein